MHKVMPHPLLPLPPTERKERLELKLALELLQALMEKPYGTSLLSVGVRDPAATRTATLRIIAALFHHCKLCMCYVVMVVSIFGEIYRILVILRSILMVLQVH